MTVDPRCLPPQLQPDTASSLNTCQNHTCFLYDTCLFTSSTSLFEGYGMPTSKVRLFWNLETGLPTNDSNPGLSAKSPSTQSPSHGCSFVLYVIMHLKTIPVQQMVGDGKRWEQTAELGRMEDRSVESDNKLIYSQIRLFCTSFYSQNFITGTLPKVIQKPLVIRYRDGRPSRGPSGSTLLLHV